MKLVAVLTFTLLALPAVISTFYFVNGDVNRAILFLVWAVLFQQLIHNLNSTRNR